MSTTVGCSQPGRLSTCSLQSNITTPGNKPFAITWQSGTTSALCNASFKASCHVDAREGSWDNHCRMPEQCHHCHHRGRQLSHCSCWHSADWEGTCEVSGANVVSVTRDDASRQDGAAGADCLSRRLPQLLQSPFSPPPSQSGSGIGGKTHQFTKNPGAIQMNLGREEKKSQIAHCTDGSSHSRFH